MLKRQVGEVEGEIGRVGSEGGGAGERLTQLAEMKVHLKTQIEMLVDIADDWEESSPSRGSLPPGGGSGGVGGSMGSLGEAMGIQDWMPKFGVPGLDLQNIVVRVLDASADIEEESLRPAGSAGGGKDGKDGKGLF
ncbi:hypothetical protein HDV00_002072, partial [Rhizophlyctis rosea]